MKLPDDTPSPHHALQLKKEAAEELRRNEYVGYSESFILMKRKEEKLYPFKHSELHRIEQLISKIIPQAKLFRVLWPLMAGIAATSGFTLLAFLTVANVPQALWLTGFVVFILSVVFSFVFLLLDLREPDRIAISVSDALEELHFVRAQFENKASED